MEVNFTLKPEDIKAFEAQAATGKGLPPWGVALIFLTVGPASFYLSWTTRPRPRYILPHEHAHPNPWLLILSRVLPVLIFATFWGLILWSQKRQREKAWQSPFFARPHTVVLTPASLFHRNHGASESHTAWSALHKIAQNDGGIFFFFSENMGLPVPSRAFDSPQEFKRFGQLARSYHQAALGVEPSPPIPNVT